MKELLKKIQRNLKWTEEAYEKVTRDFNDFYLNDPKIKCLTEYDVMSEDPTKVNHHEKILIYGSLSIILKTLEKMVNEEKN